MALPFSIAVCVFIHKQHPQTTYRKYAVVIDTILENCDKKALAGQVRPARAFYFIFYIC